MSELTKQQRWLEAVGGAKYVAQRLGITDREVRKRAANGEFPAVWFVALLEIGVEHGALVTLDLFRWKRLARRSWEPPRETPHCDVSGSTCGDAASSHLSFLGLSKD